MMFKLLFVTALAGSAFAQAADELHTDSIDVPVVFADRGGNTLRLLGGFSDRAGSYIGFSDEIHNLHLSGEIGVRLRRVEFGFTQPAWRGKPIQYGFSVYGQRFHFNQKHESSLTAFDRDVSVFSAFDPGDVLNYLSTDYGVRLL